MRLVVRSMMVLGTAAVAAAACGPTAHAATTPHAAPKAIYDCDVYQESETSADAYCSGTPSTMFRVAIQCTDGIYRYGMWKYAGAGLTSSATCPTNTFYMQGWTQSMAS